MFSIKFANHRPYLGNYLFSVWVVRMDTNYSEKGFLFGFRLIYPKQLPL